MAGLVFCILAVVLLPTALLCMAVGISLAQAVLRSHNTWLVLGLPPVFVIGGTCGVAKIGFWFLFMK